MRFQRLFLYEKESAKSRKALIRNIYLLSGLISFLFVMSDSGLALASIMLVPVIYWVPVFQNLLAVEDTRYNYLLFILILSPVFSVLAAPVGFWHVVGILWVLSIVSIISQIFLIVYSIYDFESSRYRRHFSVLKSYFDSFKASYFNLRSLKVLSALGIGLVVLVFGFSFALNSYVNSLADPVNEDAPYSEEVFESLYSELNQSETFGEQAQRISGRDLRNLSGGRLEKRLLVSGTGLVDLAVSGGDVFAAFPEDSDTPIVKGYTQVLRCPDDSYESSRNRCIQSEYPASFSRSNKGWMNLGLAMGGLNNLYGNETAMSSFENYVERSRFYDSYLMEGFEMRPLESVYYSSDSGLYVLGEGDSSVYVDGEKLNGSKSRYIFHSNISLDTGYHNVSKGGFSVQLPVYGYRPEYDWDKENGELSIAGTENRSIFFDKAIVYGNNWSETLRLGKNLTSLETQDKIEKIEFVNENMSMNVTHGLNQFSKDERPQRGQAFGMSEEEYEKFQWISGKLGFALDDPEGLE